MKKDKRGAEYIRRLIVKRAIEEGRPLSAADRQWLIGLIDSAPLPARKGRPSQWKRDYRLAERIYNLHKGGMLVRDAKHKAGEEFNVGDEVVEGAWKKYRKHVVHYANVFENFRKSFEVPLRRIENIRESFEGTARRIEERLDDATKRAKSKGG